MMTPVEQVQQWTTAACGMPAEDPTLWTVEQQATFLTESQRFMNSVAAKHFEVLAAFDANGGAQRLGARTTASWLRVQNRLSGQQAGAMVHTARALRDDLPATRDALTTGDITVDHVSAIRHAHRRLGEHFSRMEKTVADFARGHDVRQTRRLVEIVIDRYDRSANDERVERELKKRYLRLSRTLNGWWRVDGLLNPSAGESFYAAMDAFAGPCGEDDTRTPQQRRCDALEEIIDRALADIDRPSGSASVTITVTPEQLASGDGVFWPNGLLMSRTDLALHLCSCDVAYLVGIPTDKPPRWEPLAVGFAERYATRAQRRALAVRDGGCVHPGCTVRPERCIAHHILPWESGGPTDLSNLVLICRYHHRQVHLGHIDLVQTDGHYTTAVLQRAPP